MTLRADRRAVSGSNRRELKAPRGDASVLRGESSPVRRPGRRRRRCTEWHGGGSLANVVPQVPEPELLFEFLVIPLDAPAQLRERDEAVEVDVFTNGRKPELRGFLLLSWPFDQEPFLIPGNASIEVPVRGANTD